MYQIKKVLIGKLGRVKDNKKRLKGTSSLCKILINQKIYLVTKTDVVDLLPALSVAVA